jgi:hypothetical protein
MSSSKFRRFSAATTAPMRRFTPPPPSPAIDKYQLIVGPAAALDRLNPAAQPSG